MPLALAQGANRTLAVPFGQSAQAAGREPNRVLYKGKTLIYQYSDPGPLPHYIFHTPRGSVKKLSQMIVKRDVWKEIKIDD